MEFSVYTSDEIASSFHGGSTYEIGNANAVLTVNDEDSYRKITYSPSAWLRVEEGHSAAERHVAAPPARW